MAASKWPVTQLYSQEFVNFRNPLQICLLHHLRKDEWLLPKGRQDQGESLSEASLRETYEETGFVCTVLPINMETRSPSSGVDMKDRPHFVRGCTEPFTVSLRHVSERDIKFIWWFISRVASGDAEKRSGTQMRSENFESVLYNVDVDVEDEEALNAAVGRLTYDNDREIVKMAIRLVYGTYPEWFSREKD
ncbi:hypothetical protein DFH11DRAFT_1550604 [Phellopilus nigrolimitatus]|nr:hypothetical protein DFH11DRAFT_1550604 [Phellopilus nigrolimitatus]